jgi:hypothetical protein
VDTPGSARGVAVSGSNAYVADYSSGLQVIDVTNPQSPQIVGAEDMAVGARDVSVWGSYAYVAAADLQVIDITNPLSPHIVGTKVTPGRPSGVAVSGTFAYVANDNINSFTGYFQIIDITDPRAPEHVGGVITLRPANGVAILGSSAYVTLGSNGLQIVDITDPQSPQIVGSVDTPGGAYGVALSSDWAFVADGSAGLQIAWRQCGDFVPVFFSFFSAQVDHEMVTFHWNVNATGAVGDFRLVGRQSSLEWEVPFQSDGNGDYSATDRSDYGVTGELVTYSLYYRDQEEDWILLGTETIELETPEIFTRLLGVHPNPFNPQMTIHYALSASGPVRLRTFDLRGRMVAILVEEVQGAGRHEASWNGLDSRGRAMPSGTYIVRLETEVGVEARKVLLVR